MKTFSVKILERKEKKSGIYKIMSLLVGLSILSYIGLLFHTQTYTISFQEEIDNSPKMKFVFVDDDTTEYEIFQKDIHAAWINWDFLFGKNDNKIQNNKTEGTETEEKNIIIHDTQNNNSKISDYPTQPKNEDYVDDMIDDIKNKLDDVEISPRYKKCILPWGEKLEHNEYTLAYQQRNEEPSICNIQKRYCKNGRLSGSYTQNACKEKQNNKVATINRKKFKVDKNTFKIHHHTFTISHKTNKNKSNPLIQSNHKPNKYDPDFLTKNIPNSIWDNKRKGKKTTMKDGKNQIQNTKRSCRSPRGDSVNHGQFVKAYRRTKGFNNVKCEVELRICLDGVLEGNFSHQKCKYIDDIYEIYYSNPDNWDTDYEKEKIEKRYKTQTNKKIEKTMNRLIKEMEKIR